MIGAEIDIRNADLRMKPRLSIALLTALIAAWTALAAHSDAGSCRHNRSRDCSTRQMLDLSSVPEISNDVAGHQRLSRPRQNPVVDPQPAANPYTGPMIGRSPVGVPTVGYYWSIN
jgi:hypothetical protein